jgi:hypothetical protein
MQHEEARTIYSTVKNEIEAETRPHLQNSSCCLQKLVLLAAVPNQTLGLTLRPLVSPPSESCPQTLWLFPRLLHSSAQPATVRSISDCSEGQLSLR